MRWIQKLLRPCEDRRWSLHKGLQLAYQGYDVKLSQPEHARVSSEVLRTFAVSGRDGIDAWSAGVEVTAIGIRHGHGLGEEEARAALVKALRELAAQVEAGEG